jgi:hypothetical protein
MKSEDKVPTDSVSTLKKKGLSVSASNFREMMLLNIGHLLEENIVFEGGLRKNNQLPPSYNSVANMLNKKGFKTIRGKTWTRTAVKRLMGDEISKYDITIGHDVHLKLEAANISRSTKTDTFAIKMRDEVLPTIDTSQKYHIIAMELNKRGIKTRSGGEWMNVSVKRLLERIQGLSKG